MSYPSVTGNRFRYEIDGTRVGYNNSTQLQPVGTWLTDAEKTTLNDDSITTSALYDNEANNTFFFFFPEERKVEYMTIIFSSDRNKSDSSNDFISLEGSNDTTDGYDGTWTALSTVESDGTTAVEPIWRHNDYPDAWRRTPRQVTGYGTATGFKVYRAVYTLYSVSDATNSIHLYGNKSDKTDDLVFYQSDQTTEYTSVHDFGEVKEGTTQKVTTYLKNTSGTHKATDIAISIDGLNASNYTISLDDVTYGTTASIASLGAGATQAIYIKNDVGTPPQDLHPRTAFIKATPASWSLI